MLVALSPIAAAARLAGRRGRVLLDSTRDDDGTGAWSFLAADPVATLEVRGRRVIERGAGGALLGERETDPLAAIDAFVRAHGAGLDGGRGAARDGGGPDGGRSAGYDGGRGAAHDGGGPDGGTVDGVGAVRVPDAPRPRVLGFLSYDLGRAIERLPAGPTLGDDTPDAWLAAYDAVVRWPAGAEIGEIVAVDEAAAARLRAALGLGTAERSFGTAERSFGTFERRFDAPGPAPRLGALVADDDGAAHCARVARIREYIAAGDVYQVNLARRLTAPVETDGDALALHAAITAVAPAPYSGLVEADGVRVVSGSPERFLARAGAGARLDTRPIKGTRRRTGEPDRDAALAADLAAHPKDDAEHLMIVDLERNDLGRVATVGSVRVDELGYVVELPGLYHKVSTVSCELRPDVGWAELLRATFPGGSITGAPKIRAMQIIDELEPARRGPYCGAIGWMGEGGAFALAIAIRVVTLAGGELRLHVGGGIVADSEPAAELAETEDKAAGWRAALARL